MNGQLQITKLPKYQYYHIWICGFSVSIIPDLDLTAVLLKI